MKRVYALLDWKSSSLFPKIWSKEMVLHVQEINQSTTVPCLPKSTNHQQLSVLFGTVQCCTFVIKQCTVFSMWLLVGTFTYCKTGKQSPKKVPIQLTVLWSQTDTDEHWNMINTLYEVALLFDVDYFSIAAYPKMVYSSQISATV